MPREYEAIRDNLVRQGKNLKAAKSEAAAIYNTRHKDAPVTGKMEKLKGRATTRAERYGAGTTRRR